MRIYYLITLYLLLLSWLAGGPLETSNITLYFPSCGAHSVSGSNQSRLMNIRRLFDVATLKEKEHKFCGVTYRGSVRWQRCQVDTQGLSANWISICGYGRATLKKKRMY